MHLKKLSATVLTVLLAAFLFVLPVSAHGHHGHHGQSSEAGNGCPVCTVDGCTESGRHTHDGYDYCGYDHKDGYCDGSCDSSSYGTVLNRKCGSARRHCHR